MADIIQENIFVQRQIKKSRVDSNRQGSEFGIGRLLMGYDNTANLVVHYL